MAWLPTPFTVLHRAYITDAEDAHGNPVDDWTPPTTVPVYGWAAPNSTEPKRAGIDAVVVTLQVIAPVFTAGDKDRVIVQGVEYDVVGDVEDWNHGPFGFAPGVVVNLAGGR